MSSSDFPNLWREYYRQRLASGRMSPAAAWEMLAHARDDGRISDREMLELLDMPVHWQSRRARVMEDVLAQIIAMDMAVPPAGDRRDGPPEDDG